MALANLVGSYQGKTGCVGATFLEMSETLREYAERVLLSCRLEEKLALPEELYDPDPGAARTTPAAPGRPRELQFSPTDERVSFPGVHDLAREERRGLLLHFFANHELLAAELMALVLLKFPEAPADFRLGVARTLADEQRHTRIYLRRMRECGVEFGRYPVNAFFWNCIASMESPLDYVRRLSLTFEQANLDFSRYYAEQFRRIGDEATARLFDRIYRDEIGHVGYGLHWFRRWKVAGSSDWDAFRRGLCFPLSPIRAKADPFNAEGRRAAGFDEEFIRHLKVFSQSRGRTPHVHYFNPLADLRAGIGPAFTPTRRQKQFVADLENLPQFLCRRDDVVLVRRMPGVEFLSGLIDAGIEVPEFVVIPDGKIAPEDPLRSRKLGALRPWAWDPNSLELLRPLAEQVRSDRLPLDRRWSSSIRALYSKAWSTTRLQELLAELGEPDWLVPPWMAGRSCTSSEESLATIAAIRHRGHHPVAVKAAFGFSGRHTIRLLEPEIRRSQKAWIDRALRRHGCVVVVPWLPRVLDLSIQMDTSGDAPRLVAITQPINDLQGQLRECQAATPWTAPISSPLRQFLRGSGAGKSNRFLDLVRLLVHRLGNAMQSTGYFGPAGIDALVYRDLEGSYRLFPIVEVNPRYTMGRLAAELMRFATPGSRCSFQLIHLHQARKQGFANLADFYSSQQAAHPIVRSGQPHSRIHSGFIALNEITPQTQFLALLHVTRNAKPKAKRTTT